MRRSRVLTRTLLVTLLGLGFALAGCGAEEGPPLESTFWICTEISFPEGESTDVIDDTYVDMFLQNGQASGSSGCNRYNGSYVVDGGSISIGPLTSTLMACEAPLMDQEQAFMVALEAAATYSIDGETLTLMAEDGSAVAVFAADDEPLTGEEWSCTGYNNGQQAVVSLLAGTGMTLGFTEDGTAKGSSGCNTYSMEYETGEEGAMSFGDVTSTEMACTDPVGIMEQEASYLEALSTVTAYELRGNQLTLRRDDGAIAATYTRS